MPEFHLYLPQMRMTLATMVERADAAERAGFDGVALMDHLAPPLAEDQPMHDAVVTASWLAAHTSTATIGHLVLCDAFRHPAVLAKQAVTLDNASAGRFELGLGWGSVPSELTQFGIGTAESGPRVERLAETLDVLAALWSGRPVDYHGRHHHLRSARQLPVPSRPIPIVVGGAGERTMGIVARHAQWWNCPYYALGRLDELSARAGSARISVQQMVAYVPDDRRRNEVVAVVERRFGPGRDDIIIGTGNQIVDELGTLASRGVERFYLWFADFAPPATLRAVGAEVISQMR